MKKRMSGSFTIEASFVVPIVLLVFMVGIYFIFYFHDKNILMGAVYETAVVGSERMECKEEELETYFRRRIKGKLIIFTDVKEEIELKEDAVRVLCRAKRKRMRIHCQIAMRKTEPEAYIRKIRKIKEIGEN